jgi:hypothetical protein
MNLKSDATVWGICDKGSFYLIMLRRANGYDNVKIVKFGFVFFYHQQQLVRIPYELRDSRERCSTEE